MATLKRLATAFLGGPLWVVLFGLLFFGIGAGLTYHQRSFERRGVEAQGEVISMTSSCDSDGCTYAPLVRFKPDDGEMVTFQTDYYSSPPEYRTGQRVTVVYDPEQPEKAVIRGQGQIFRLIFSALGGLVVVFGMWMFYSNLRGGFSGE